MDGTVLSDKTIIIIAVVVLALLFVGVWFFVRDGGDAERTENGIENEAETRTTAPGMHEIDVTGEFVAEDITVGEGAEARDGSTVAVHYVGALTDGTVFDSSIPRGQPFVFTIGAGQVIQGWEQGIAGMKVGGVRRLVIPPELGYGARDMGSIPPNSTLIFEVQLLGIQE